MVGRVEALRVTITANVTNAAPARLAINSIGQKLNGQPGRERLQDAKAGERLVDAAGREQELVKY